MNPLLSSFDTAPFSEIKNEHFKPAFLKAMADARAEIDAITSTTEAPTFENTIEALEFSGQQLDGWMVTLDYPSYIPFMKYAKNRALRKQLSLAFGSKSFKGDELDNQDNVLYSDYSLKKYPISMYIMKK